MVHINGPESQRGLFTRGATTTDLHRDGSELEPGSHVYKHDTADRSETLRPVTVVVDNGSTYYWVEGHVDMFASNDRSTLYPTDRIPLSAEEFNTVQFIRAICAHEYGDPFDFPYFWGSYQMPEGQELDTVEQAKALSKEFCDRELLRMFVVEKIAGGRGAQPRGDFETVMVLCHG
jgi:hypothetical protein